MNENVIVTSMVTGTVVIHLPQNGYNVRKVWPKKGTKLSINKDSLREGFYKPGIEEMFRDGTLYIDDMDLKIELGLEEPETKVPTQIIPLDEKYANRVLKLMPVPEMRAALQGFSQEQVYEFLDYAASQTDVSINRLNVIKEVTGVDPLKLIDLKNQKGE
jgi:hypothetical protein